VSARKRLHSRPTIAESESRICFLLSLIYCLLWVVPAQAATITAASCNYSDVNAAINGPTHTAVDGDTITIPSGSCAWSNGIVVPSNIGITIIGNGTPQSGSAVTGASTSCGNTTITITNGITAFRMTPKYGNSTSRLSCMDIASGSGSGIAASILGTCSSSGCPNLRMDNITFSNWAGHTEVGISYGITAIGDIFGVIDHNTINGSAGNYLELVEQSNASYQGVGYYGDNAWAQPEAYGTANFLFFENNTFNDAGCCESEGSAGGLVNQGGGRVVARYNQFSITDNYNFSMGWHGTESSGRPRSTRAYEYYKNTWSCNSTVNGCAPVIGARGGTGIVWGNTLTATTGSTFDNILIMNTYRTQGTPSSTWGACDGSAVYDTNDGTTYYSGTIGSISGSGPYTITVSGSSPGWNTNQWSTNGSPYSVHNVTKLTGSEIIASGANTLTIPYTGGPGAWIPSVGDSIQILRATVCIDQAGGRGKGILYNSSDNPANSTPANNAPSPTYLWMNSESPAPIAVAYSDTARVIQNRDFYMETANQTAQTSSASPFNGTTGMGHGTLANRPTSCTPSPNGGTEGTAYWETDHNQLDFCIGTNTWSTTTSSPASYTPYTYPHPLVSGSPPPSCSPCDVNCDGVVNVVDVQLEVNMALGISSCANPDGQCTVVQVQRVVNAALGGQCVTP